jgi:hypothetical protein
VFVALLVVGLTVTVCAQDDAVAKAAIASGTADLGAARSAINGTAVQTGSLSSVVFDADTGAVIGGFGASLKSGANVPIGGGNDDHFDLDDTRPNKPTIPGLDTIATFDGAFLPQAGPNSTGTRLFRWTMMGNDPKIGDTTVFSTPIDEISWQLLNADGSVFKVVKFDPFEQATLESPNFEPLNYRSGRHIEFGDAVHRAQFFHRGMQADWHTLLIPKVINRVTITVPFFVNVQLSNGNVVQARSYFTGTAADGSTFVLMLNLLFDFFWENEAVNQINNGNFKTNAMNLSMFPNTFLFSLNQNNPNVPGGCCVLGFHTYFFEPGAIPQPRWVTQVVSWISPGIFGGGFQDVTALTHELAETFGDPFIDNATPSWQFPGQPANSKVCQANLEEGDPIEVLANATTVIEVKEGKFDFKYHPQNIPLLQWFEMGAKSDAIDGAFSFPDETVLPHSAVPCPQ